jgi:hypothetical protein
MTDVRENLATHAIPREVAKRKFRNWIDYATAKLNFTPATVPKSIFIPIIDVNNLIIAYRRFGKGEMSGIRVYFIRDEPYETHPDGLYLKCMVVPTVQSGKDHKDAILTIPALKTTGHGGSAARIKTMGGDDSGGTETIYDFTTSCPPDCDEENPWQ